MAVQYVTLEQFNQLTNEFNSFKTFVSQTYVTKDEYNKKIQELETIITNLTNRIIKLERMQNYRLIFLKTRLVETELKLENLPKAIQGLENLIRDYDSITENTPLPKTKQEYIQEKEDALYELELYKSYKIQLDNEIAEL